LSLSGKKERIDMAISRQFKGLFFVLGLAFAPQGVAWAEDAVDPLLELQQNIDRACPKQWEDLFSDIELNPNVLDVWQGDLTDRAQFVQYANEFLADENGALLIDNYHDEITIMTECAVQRTAYYKIIRQQIGASVSGMVNMLTGQAAFGRNSIAGGIDYSDWLEGNQGEIKPGTPLAAVNLAFGRGTSQSGTTSEELALLELNPDPDVETTEEEYGEMVERNGYAVNAVDNNISGQLVDGSVTYTGFQDQPFWQVELDGLSTLGSIVIYNRMDDCCSQRLDDFYIMISESPITHRTLPSAIEQAFVVGGGPQPYFSEASKVFNLPAGTEGKYVRIQLSGSNTVLSLAEVKVLGYPISESSEQVIEDTLLKKYEL
jgi:hypothetical protein